jgi:hypothetical protein
MQCFFGAWFVSLMLLTKFVHLMVLVKYGQLPLNCLNNVMLVILKRHKGDGGGF